MLPENIDWGLFVQAFIVLVVLFWLFRTLQSVFKFVVVLVILHIYIFYWLLPELLHYYKFLAPTPSGVMVAPTIWDTLRGVAGRVVNATGWGVKTEL